MILKVKEPEKKKLTSGVIVSYRASVCIINGEGGYGEYVLTDIFTGEILYSAKESEIHTYPKGTKIEITI
jgi:hypothetical protein